MTDTVALSDATSPLSSDEQSLIGEMLERLSHYDIKNQVKEDYYEAKQKVTQLGLSLPPAFKNLQTTVGWAGTTVDVLRERLEWEGWTSDTGDDFGLRDVYLENQLHVDSGKLIMDALIFGTAFLVVGAAQPGSGEPNPLITVESPRRMTGIWNARTRRLSAALGVNAVDGNTGKVTDVTLYLPNANIRAESSGDGDWFELERNEHNLGRVLVVQVFNRTRASKQGGKSEITRAIRSYVDIGVRTLTGMEVSREFYAFPQRYILGAEKEMFQNSDGTMRPGWQTMMSSIWAAPDVLEDKTDSTSERHRVDVGQFPQGSPEPFLAILRNLTQMVAGESGMPAHYFGFATDNPASADAIRAGEQRLIKQAEERQAGFGAGLNEAGKLAILVRDGKLPDGINALTSKWRDPATPTQAASADAITKLVGAGVLDATSEVVLDKLNLSPQEKAQVLNERRKGNANKLVQDIRAAQQATQSAPVTPPDAPVAEE
jgi:hypothetical protein